MMWIFPVAFVLLVGSCLVAGLINKKGELDPSQFRPCPRCGHKNVIWYESERRSKCKQCGVEWHEPKGSALYVYPSPKAQENEAIQEDLARLGSKYKVVVVAEGHVLAGYHRLPCIQTEAGESVQGAEAIHQFAQEHVTAGG